MPAKPLDNCATLRMPIASPRIGKAALNMVNFMNDNPDSGLQRQAQGADTLATLETIACWLASDPVVSAFLCRMVEQEKTASTLRDIAQELQAQVRHADDISERLRSEIETHVQTIQRHELTANLWQVAADTMNDLLADTPEASLSGILVDRLRVMVGRITEENKSLTQENRRLHACPAPQSQ